MWPKGLLVVSYRRICCETCASFLEQLRDFDTPGSTPRNDRSATAGIHSRHSRVVDLDVKAAIRNVLGCISPPFGKSFVRRVCVCVMALEFRFLEIPSELRMAAGFSMHDWESRDDEMFLLLIFALDDI